jgi:hypothetical protein
VDKKNGYGGKKRRNRKKAREKEKKKTESHMAREIRRRLIGQIWQLVGNSFSVGVTSRLVLLLFMVIWIAGGAWSWRGHRVNTGL